jgi:lysophospholipase L1-like esterase
MTLTYLRGFPHLGASRPGGLVLLDAPVVVESVAFYGDSFTFGVPNGGQGGPSDLAHRYSTLTAGLLDATEENHGIGGARNHLSTGYILTNVYQTTAPPSVAPYGPVHQVAVIQVSINNLNLNPVIANLGIITDALKRAIHRLRAAGTYEALGGAAWSWTGSWQDVPTLTANTGTGVKRAFTNGDAWTLAVPADFPGGVLRVYGPKATGFGAVETITVDGAAHGTIDNRTATIQSGSEAWAYPIALSAGAHTVHGVVSSISTVENINGADFALPTRPFVVVLNTARAPVYPGGEHTTTGADVVASNAAVAAMLSSEFAGDPDVALVDIDALLGANPANFGSDSIHPGNAGTALMAAAISEAIIDGLS